MRLRCISVPVLRVPRLAALLLAGVAGLTACDDTLAPLPSGPFGVVDGGVAPSFALTRAINLRSLGTLGSGSFHAAKAINNLGHVVGVSSGNGGELRAFYWSAQGGMVDIGTAGRAASRALDINDADLVVGTLEDSLGVGEAFTWTPRGGIRPLGQFGGVDSRALGVNNLGEVVGTYTPAFNPADPSTFRGVQAYHWSPSAGFTELPTLGNPFGGVAYGINDAGQVVGVSSVSPDPNAPFLSFVWSRAAGIRNLGSLGGGFSEHDAFALNALGDVAGGAYHDADGIWHPFVWRQGRGFTDLTTRGFPAGVSGVAIDVNALGHLAVLVLEPDGTRRPAVWVERAGLVFMPTLGGVDGEIWGINDLGQIVGWSQTSAGAMRPAVWSVRFSPEDRITDVVATLTDLLPSVTSRKVAKQLNETISKANKALARLARQPPDLKKAIEQLAKAVESLQKAIKAGFDPALGQSLTEVLVESARDLAVGAIANAQAAGGDPGRIARARSELARGDAARQAGKYKKAVEAYKKAAEQALKA